jgi:hypothetical protein
MIDSLSDTDLFFVIAFDSEIESPPGLVYGLTEANDRNRFRAVEYLSGLGARGGTEMAGPLGHAVARLNEVSPEDRDRVLVLVTDGQIGNEDQILETLGRKLKGIRVFTLGIDQAVNEAFLRRLAERGGGACELVESEQRLDEVMQSIHRRIGSPLLTGLFLEGEGLAIEPGDVVPRRLPDLFSGSPLLILGRYHGRALGSLAIRATDTAGRAWSESVPATIRDNPAIASAWARGQIRQLEDRYVARDGDRTALERSIVAISLKFNVLCRFTACVAVDRSQKVNRGGSIHQVTQPVEMPQGWDADSGIKSCRRSLAETLGGSSREMSGGVADWGLAKVFGAGEVGGKQKSLPLDRMSAGDSTPYVAEFCSPEETASSYDCRTFIDPVEEDSPPCGPPPSGEIPDRFKTARIIALGGMGRVCEAYDRDLDRDICLKIIHHKSGGAETLERLRREKEALERLSHPTIPAALEVGQSGDSCWVAIARFKGRTLAEMLRDAGVLSSFPVVAKLIAEVAEALHAAHEHGLAHGDLTASNIFLSDDGQVRLFGFKAVPLMVADSSSLVRVACTPAYMAPELARADSGVNYVSVDVYALGVVLYQIVTGHVPFSDARISILIRRILDEKPKPPRKIVRSIPAALEAICLKALAKRPADRYATAGQMAAALRKFLVPSRRPRFWKSS